MAAARHPRSIWSVVLIGLVLAPMWLMLWIGRGWLALLYLGVSIALGLFIFLAERQGVISAAPILLNYSQPELLLNGALHLFGVVHGLSIRETSLNRPWYRWLATAAIVLLLVALPVRTFLFQPFSIPSLSSYPNLNAGDYVFVSKYAYGYSRYSFPFGLVNFAGRILGASPKRGDLAVFRLPSDTSTDYVKRVIGLPGDRIQMKAGRLFINDVMVDRQPAEPQGGSDLKFYRETLPEGTSYIITEMTDTAAADNTEVYLVPAGHYFALGDNRDNSQDSRYLDRVGYIPEQNFIGPVILRIASGSGPNP